VAKKLLRAAEGFTLHKTGHNTIALMRNNGATGTSFTCDCQSTTTGTGSGGCRVDMEGTTASCENDGCGGECRWSVHIPGLVGVHALHLSDRIDH
jgi:hypothetical protein